MARNLSHRRSMQLETLEDRALFSGDLVIQWNEIMRETVRTTGTAATYATRIMAITHGAMYDAVNTLDRTHAPFLVDTLAHPRASREAAVAAAAHRALVALFPTQTATLDAKFNAMLVAIPDGKSEDDGVALGRSVAEQTLAIRHNDGSDNTLPPYTGGSAPGQWRPTPTAFAPGREPHWGGVTPFAMTSADQFGPGAPASLDSVEYTAAFNAVKELGSATSATRTADQTAMALYWNNSSGTATPPGHMNLLAQVVAQQQGNTLEENARLFAALNVAMADSLISAWDAKYEYSFWRPVSAIRLAADDGNTDTVPDIAWSPLISTPAHPSYTSAHSSVSGAAAAVLADFFGTDSIAFTLPSQNPALPARSFTSFSHAAQESADSRLYGGIHWSFDNSAGLISGNAIGLHVMANFLRPVEQAAAAGVVSGELVVVGTPDTDLLQVNRVGGRLVVSADGQRLGDFDTDLSGIVVDAGDGDDLILMAHQIQTNAELYGGRGNDLVTAGSGDDRVYGEAGSDMLLGNAGQDRLDGGDGDDLLFGGLGNDELLGGLGDDWLFGGLGLDLLNGGAGHNRLFQ